jgi:carbon storage regulator
MLVLTRKIGESIVIGDDIVVKVIETGKNSVRIGIDAPKHI